LSQHQFIPSASILVYSNGLEYRNVVTMNQTLPKEVSKLTKSPHPTTKMQ